MFRMTSPNLEKCQKYGASSLTALMSFGECFTIADTSALLPEARRLTTLVPKSCPGAAKGCWSGSLWIWLMNRSASAGVNGVRFTTIVERSPALLSCAATRR